MGLVSKAFLRSFLAFLSPGLEGKEALGVAGLGEGPEEGFGASGKVNGRFGDTRISCIGEG